MEQILTIQLTDAEVEFMGEEIAPGFVRLTGSSDPHFQQLIAAKPEFSTFKLEGDCTLTTDEADPVEDDPREDDEDIEVQAALAWSRQVNDYQQTGRGA